MITTIISKIALKVVIILAVRALGKAIKESSLATQHPKVCKFMKRFIPNFIVHHLDDISEYGHRIIELVT